MDINTLDSLYTSQTLPNNYYPIYVRSSGKAVSGVVKPSVDIFKYRIVDERTLYIKKDVNYLDLVSYNLYKNYSHTRTLYTLNSSILDPFNTKQYTVFAVLEPRKLLTTIQQGILRTTKRINYSLEPVSISYIFKSLVIDEAPSGGSQTTPSTKLAINIVLSEIQNSTVPVETKRNVVAKDILQQIIS
jgi:hypothetical protein